MCGLIWMVQSAKNIYFLRRIAYCRVDGEHFLSIDGKDARSCVSHLRSDFDFIPLQRIQHIFSQPHLLHQADHLFDAAFPLLVKTIQRMGIPAVQVIVKILCKFVAQTVFCR